MRELIIKILKEEVGVPSGIVDSSKNLYTDLIYRLKRKTVTGQSEFNLMFINKNNKYSFSDYNSFEKINVMFEFHTYDETEEHKDILVFGMGHESKAFLENNSFKLINNVDNTITLSITFAIPSSMGEITNKDIINVFLNNKTQIISSLAHELKHAYDNLKTPYETVKNRSSYSIFSKLRFGIEEVDKFIYNLYFISAIENLVRPTELYSLMQEGGISQKDFLEFITSNKTYQTLKEINNFNLSNMIDSLKNKPDLVDKFIEETSDYEIPDDIDKKVKVFLEILYLVLSENIVKNATSILSNNFFEQMFGLSDEKAEFIRSFEKDILKFRKNPLQYFEYQEKRFKFESEKMMKKLSKLYSLSKPNPIKLVNKDPMTIEMDMLETKLRKINSK